MAISAIDWETEVENALVSHIQDSLMAQYEEVDIFIERELTRPFAKPVVTVGMIGYDEEPTGGMNVVSDTEQGYYNSVDFFITVNTDKNTGAKLKRNQIGSILNKIAFNQRRHLLLSAVGGIDMVFRSRGHVSGGISDTTWFQSHYMLTLKLIVPFTSTVL